MNIISIALISVVLIALLGYHIRCKGTSRRRAEARFKELHEIELIVSNTSDINTLIEYEDLMYDRFNANSFVTESVYIESERLLQLIQNKIKVYESVLSKQN